MINLRSTRQLSQGYSIRPTRRAHNVCNRIDRFRIDQLERFAFSDSPFLYHNFNVLFTKCLNSAWARQPASTTLSKPILRHDPALLRV
ncbi:hypothetical protein VTK56DRAFT_8513 [Thermocarpiscus australiensis]